MSPTLGNHDTFPLGKFDLHSPNGDEFFNSWSSAWEDMIIEPDAIAKFKQWGYYSATLTSKNGAGLGATPTKVISLNTNFCVWANFEAYS